jgi:hypothetical protein
MNIARLEQNASWRCPAFLCRLKVAVPSWRL